MPAYVIANVEVFDPEAYADYTQSTPASIAAHGGRFLVRGGHAEALEGTLLPRRVLVIEFPDVDAARAWWRSDDYRTQSDVRRTISRGDFILVDGVEG
jgi:uncharacterized protein (DUF1330 family)